MIRFFNIPSDWNQAVLNQGQTVTVETKYKDSNGPDLAGVTLVSWAFDEPTGLYDLFSHSGVLASDHIEFNALRNSILHFGKIDFSN